ncbi:MAG: HAD-IB family phosphatase [Clostridia bacterium]|nr:HAD-IB family phosphatase [Clostridia bacterium]
MIGYDFDDTVYYGDSTKDFIFYCLKRQPTLIRFVPRWGWNAMLWKVFKVKTKTQFKEKLYSYFAAVKDIDGYVSDFWAGHFKNIKPWYLEQKKEDDVIISASPDFLLRPAIERLGITYFLASRVDKKTGKYEGENCWGEEKVRRFKAAYPEAVIESFYSDSRSDAPMARLARGTSYLVKDDVITPWDL